MPTMVLWITVFGMSRFTSHVKSFLILNISNTCPTIWQQFGSYGKTVFVSKLAMYLICPRFFSKNSNYNLREKKSVGLLKQHGIKPSKTHFLLNGPFVTGSEVAGISSSITASSCGAASEPLGPTQAQFLSL